MWTTKWLLQEEADRMIEKLPELIGHLDDKSCKEVKENRDKINEIIDMVGKIIDCLSGKELK